MWKKEVNVFAKAAGANYLGFAADLKSNVFEAQQSSKVADAVPQSGPVARLELKAPLASSASGNSRKRSTAEVVNDAVEAANVHDRLVEKAARYEAGEGSDVLDHEKKMFDKQKNNVVVDQPQTVKALLDRIPVVLKEVGNPDVEAAREDRRRKRLEILASRKNTSERVQALLKE